VIFISQDDQLFTPVAVVSNYTLLWVMKLIIVEASLI